MSNSDVEAMRRIPLELFNEGNMSVVDDVVADDYVEHATLPPGLPPGRAGLKAFVMGLRAAFPDFHYELEDEISDGDRIVQRFTANGTQEGEFAGMPATGSPRRGPRSTSRGWAAACSWSTGACSTRSPWSSSSV